MRIEPISLADKNPLIADYKNHFTKIQDKFQYDLNDNTIWKKRLEYLESQSFNREKLAEELTVMNDRYNASEEVFDNINKLKDERTSVIVGGQQAGLLTGPLYTVHKIISIIQLARQTEQQTGRPVVPVFWIAGEDHDFAEINHIYMKKNGRMEKVQAAANGYNKSSVTDRPFNQQEIHDWLESIFFDLNETEYSVDIVHRLKQIIDTSSSYTDFFAKLVHQLFPSEGLILLDAHDPQIRKLESSYFVDMIKNNNQIAEGVYSSEQKSKQQGYPVSLDNDIDDAHLFYHHKGERVLLVRDTSGGFTGKNGEVTFTQEQLLATAENRPWLLSNNVVTRPLMQECLLPVLAFVGGPGEISYWSALKPGFDALDLEMPPVFQRLSFTLLDRKSDQWLKRMQIDEQEVIEQGVGARKLSWLAATGSPPVGELAEEVKKEMEVIHRPLREKASQLSPDMSALAEKNWDYIKQSVDFLEKRMNQSIQGQYRKQIDTFDELNLLLHPFGGFQERVWSIIPWINTYGMTVFERLNSHHLALDESHYVVKI
ncbi:bacillithiol biosynthesis cysteine-adding enzyme BshC [Halobacillus andaensis]|uniref:bacillithiol biosynthesis cysteine-adding enzyme BshC n=1 Tax=Halobacillus andaensis TaxID=1176239 RepID=UPI003D7131BA